MAAWTDARFVNRRDAHGAYIAAEDRRPGSGPTALTAKAEPTKAVLERHYLGSSTGHLVGLHSTTPVEAAGDVVAAPCRCRWLAVDIDRHDDATDPLTTFKAALALHDSARELGFRPLLLDSNGRGGFHVVVIFDRPAPAERVFAFGRWLTRDYKALGLDTRPETFPKQPGIGPGGFGNWLRLPGRHHTHDHWTRVWDGSSWCSGDDAIDLIVATVGTSADLMPMVDALPVPTRVAKAIGRAETMPGAFDAKAAKRPKLEGPPAIVNTGKRHRARLANEVAAMIPTPAWAKPLFRVTNASFWRSLGRSSRATKAGIRKVDGRLVKLPDTPAETARGHAATA